MAKEKIKIPLSRRIFRYTVNSFIYLFIFLIMLMIFVFIISQTSAFKNWIKEKIVEIVNQEINGELSIGKLDGTIFTSIKLQDVALKTVNNDTVAYFSDLIVKTSPFKLLFKDIHVRKIELKNAYFNLLEESDGELNLLKIFPPSDEPEDTTSSEFPFTISVAELDIINFNFTFQNYENRGSDKSYKSLNTNDLKISDLNLSLSAFVNLKQTDFRLSLKRFDFKPNLDFFELKNFSGNFLLNKTGAMIDNLNIETQNSKLNLSAAISEIDFINNFSTESIENAPLKVILSIENFNLNNLSSFVESTEFLSGNISGELSATGSLNNLSVDKLNLQTGQTNLIAKARLQNLLDADNILINAELDNSVITMKDVSNLLLDLGIPDYNLGRIKFNKLRFDGKPTEFASEVFLESPFGRLSLKSSFDFKQKNPKYDLSITTNNLDISPFVKSNTNLNTEIKISGEGFNPESMKADLSINSNNSRFENLTINSLELSSRMYDKILNYELNMFSDSSAISLDGKIDFIRPNDPYFNLYLQAKAIDISKVLSDSVLASNINLNIDLEGRGFDVDSMNLFMVTDIKESSFSNFNIDSTRIILDVRRNDNGNKILNLISNVADFTIRGNYRLTSLINTLSKEAQLITNQIFNKISKPLDLENQDSKTIQSENISNQTFEAKLLLDFKDFVPIKLDSKSSIEIGGEIKGNLVSEENSILLTLDSDLNYLKLLFNDDLFFTTKSKVELNLKQFTTREENFNTIFSSKISSERIYFGNNIYNFQTNISLDRDTINFSAKGELEDFLAFNLSSNNYFDDDNINLEINSVNLNYNGISISNPEVISLSYSKGDIFFNKFNLGLAQGNFEIKGKFGKSSDGLLTFNLKEAQSNDVLDKLLNISPSSRISSLINLSGEVKGDFSNPIVSLKSNVDDILINDRLLGSISSDINYTKENVNIDFKILEKHVDKVFERLLITGNIPIKNASTTDDTITTDKEIDLKIIADDLYLTSLGKLFPQIEIKGGFLESEVFIKGTLNKPIVIGYLNVNDLIVNPEFNNLDYYINSNFYWDDEDISIDKFSITNQSNIRFGGSLHGAGAIKLKGLSLDSVFVNARGNIKVLDQVSRDVNPFIYGDLTIETKSDVTFLLDKDKINVTLPLNITRADVVLPLARTAYANTSDIIYRFANGNGKSEFETELDKLVEEFQRRRDTTHRTEGKREFNYNIDVGISNEAKVVVILSKELNQDLTALLSGNISLISKDGVLRTSGQFNLLEGSKLSFIKTFEARGNVRFENLNNPLLDITATYRDYYYPVTETGQSTEQEVAVKIKLKGPLSELNQNFVKDPGNIGVYVGTENIQKEQRDETKTPTDALFFIIAGKFTDGATLQERSTVASTATSFAGSLIGNVLNQYLGDYVRSVQLRQFGDQTKFSLIGKVGNFRYEIGGTTEVFQDLSRANVKIELPIKERLILRLERKESFTDQSAVNAYLYNEFGIKYKFEF